MNRISPSIEKRNMSKYTIEAKILMAIALFLLVLLVVGTLQTIFKFKPDAETIMSHQAVMQSELDVLESKQVDMQRDMLIGQADADARLADLEAGK